MASSRTIRLRTGLVLSVLIYLTTTVTTNVRADEFMDGIASGQYGDHELPQIQAKPRETTGANLLRRGASQQFANRLQAFNTMYSILDREPALDISESEHQPPRDWTLHNETKTVIHASLWGVDHHSQRLILKMPGRSAEIFNWEEFSADDVFYLMQRSIAEAERRKEDKERAELIRKKRLWARAIGIRKMQNRIDSLQRTHRHYYRLMTDPTYRKRCGH